MANGLSARLLELVERERATPSRPSARQIAGEVGIAHSYLNALIHGEKDNPTMDVLAKLAHRFRTTPDYLWTGNRAVNIWQDLLSSTEFPVLSKPTRTRGDRFNWVVRHLSSVYPGHLSISDLAIEMECSESSLRACLDGEWHPTDEQLTVVGELSGVPERWLRFGLHAFLPNPDNLLTLGPEALNQYLETVAIAAEHQVPPKVLRTAVEIWLQRD